MGTTATTTIKCPKCNARINWEVFICVTQFGSGFNFKPKYSGNVVELSTVMCPKCQYVDYVSEFKQLTGEVDQSTDANHHIIWNADKSNIAEKFSILARRSEQKEEYAKAAWEYLKATWFMKEDELVAGLKNVFNLLIKTFETPSEVKKMDFQTKVMYANLMLCIPHQLGLEKHREELRIAQRIARKIILRFECLKPLWWHSIDAPSNYQLPEASFKQYRHDKPKGESRFKIVRKKLLAQGLGLEEVNRRIQHNATNLVNQKINPASLEPTKKFVLLKSIDSRVASRAVVENKKLILKSMGLSYGKNEDNNNYVLTFDILKRSMRKKPVKKVRRRMLIEVLREAHRSINAAKMEYVEALQEFRIRDFPEFRNELLEQGELGLVEILDMKTGRAQGMDEGYLREYLPRMLRNKKYENYRWVVKRIGSYYDKERYSEYDKKLLHKIAALAFSDCHYSTAFEIYAELKDDRGMFKVAKKSAEVGLAYLCGLDNYAGAMLQRPGGKQIIRSIALLNLKSGYYWNASKFCILLKYKKGILECAECYLKNGQISEAQKLYSQAGTPFKPRRDKLIRIGCELLKKGDEMYLRNGIRIFELADHRKGLIEAGDIALNKFNSKHTAEEAYLAANYPEGLPLLREAYARDDLASCIPFLYEKFGVKPNEQTKEFIITNILKAVRRGYYEDALELLNKEGYKDPRIEVELQNYAHYLIQIGHPGAFEIYKKIWPREALLGLGDKLCYVRRLFQAKQAYSLGGLDAAEMEKRMIRAGVILDELREEIRKKEQEK